MKEFAVKMENIINKMTGKGPEAFFRFHIFLSAYMAIPAYNRGSAIEAVLFFTFWLVGHAKFFLKIGTKTPVAVMFETFPKPFSIFDETIS
jgi:hypothetical protein